MQVQEPSSVSLYVKFLQNFASLKMCKEVYDVLGNELNVFIKI
jgi:hypothetical protein